MVTRDTWIGIISAVPISLITGLMVEPIRRWMKSFVKSRAEAKRESLLMQYETVLYFMMNPQPMIERMFIAVFDALLGGAIQLLVLFFSVAFWIVFEHSPVPGHRTSKLISIVVISMILNGISGIFLGKAYWIWRMVQRVAHWGDFFKRVPPSLRDRAKELDALNIRYPHYRKSDDDEPPEPSMVLK